jgi:hypothetical protein
MAFSSGGVTERASEVRLIAVLKLTRKIDSFCGEQL